MGQAYSVGRVSPPRQKEMREKRRCSTRSLPGSARLVGPTVSSRRKLPEVPDAWRIDSAPYHLGASNVSYHRGPRSLDIQPTLRLTDRPAHSNWSDVASDIGARSSDRYRRSRREAMNSSATMLRPSSKPVVKSSVLDEAQVPCPENSARRPRYLETCSEESLRGPKAERKNHNHNELSSVHSTEGNDLSKSSNRFTHQRTCVSVSVQTEASIDLIESETKLRQLEIENRRLARFSERQKQEYDQLLDGIEQKVLRALTQQNYLKKECVRLRKALSLQTSCAAQVARRFDSAWLPVGLVSSPSLQSVNDSDIVGIDYSAADAGEQLCSRPQSLNLDILDIHRVREPFDQCGERSGCSDPIFPFGDDMFYHHEISNLAFPEDVSLSDLTPTQISDHPDRRSQEELLQSVSTAWPAGGSGPMRQYFTSLRRTQSAVISISPMNPARIRSYSDPHLGVRGLVSPEIGKPMDAVEYAMFKGYADMEGHGYEAMVESCLSIDSPADCIRLEDVRTEESIYETIQRYADIPAKYAAEILEEIRPTCLEEDELSATVITWATQLRHKPDDKAKVVRYTASGNRRPTIMKRSVFFHPFGHLERAALAKFQFLDNLRCSSVASSLHSERNLLSSQAIPDKADRPYIKRSNSWSAEVPINLTPSTCPHSFASSMHTSCSSSLFLSDFHPNGDADDLSSSGSSLSFGVANVA